MDPLDLREQDHPDKVLQSHVKGSTLQMQQGPFKKRPTISNQNHKSLENPAYGDCLCRLLLELLASALSSMVILFILASVTKTSKLCSFWVETSPFHLPLRVSQFQTDEIQHPSTLQPSCRALHLLRRKVQHLDAASDMLAMPGASAMELITTPNKSERCRITDAVL